MSQRLHEVQVDVGVVADPPLGRPAADVVLDTPAGVDVDRAVVFADREVDRELALDLPQSAPRVVRKAYDVGGDVESALSGLESGSAGDHKWPPRIRRRSL